MNNPLALCELAARAPNISVGHMIKQDWLLNDHVFILDCSLSCADVRCPNWLKQRKSPLDHPFRSIYGENRKLSYKDKNNSYHENKKLLKIFYMISFFRVFVIKDLVLCFWGNSQHHRSMIELCLISEWQIYCHSCAGRSPDKKTLNPAFAGMTEE